MILYGLKPDGEGRILLDSVHVGGAPVTGTLGRMFWEKLAAELQKTLSPGLENLRILNVGQGTLDLGPVRSATPETAQP